MCGALVTLGAAQCRSCGADLTRSGVVLSTVTPISRRPTRHKSPPIFLVAAALVVAAVVVSLSPLGTRLPFLKPVHAGVGSFYHLLASLGKSIHLPQSATAQPPIPQPKPLGAVPVESTVPAAVTILSDPAGAEVTLDAAKAGITPLTLESLDPGQHIVSVQRTGYQPNARTFTVSRGESLTLSMTLRPNARTARKPAPTTPTTATPAAARKPLEIGMPAPHFVLKDRVGIIYRLNDLRGQRVAVLFVWTMDATARVRIKELDIHARRGYTPIVIALIPDRVAIRNYIAAEQIRTPILFGNVRMAELYGVSHGVSLLYVISEQGIIVQRHTGANQLASQF